MNEQTAPAQDENSLIAERRAKLQLAGQAHRPPEHPGEPPAKFLRVGQADRFDRQVFARLPARIGLHDLPVQ